METELFYKRLTRLRSDRRMTVSALARKIGVSSSTYRAWEYGRSIQGPESFVKLSKALEVPLSELMDGSPDEISEIQQKLEQAEELIREVKLALLSLY
jgi:transcriptional regulator with XRE-family HTH domain